MRSFIIVFLSLFCGSTFCDSSQDKSLMRDLIILLDDFEATNPNKEWGILYDLQNALDAEAAPILFNESLWCTFIEARQEWLLQAQIPDTDEYKCTVLRNQINERANYWYNILSEHSDDDLHIRTLMGDKVNEEFYTKESYERLQASGIIPQGISSKYVRNLRSTTLSYHFDRWYWFYLSTGYYVAIPKVYCEKYTSSTDLVEIMRAVGFNTSVALHSVDPLAVEPSLDLISPTVDTTIMAALQELLLQKKPNSDNYTWTIKIMGHGSRWRHPCVLFQEMVGITPERFKELCIFLDTYISVRILYVESCHAGGVNRLQLTDNGTTYTYPIVIACVGDNITWTHRDASESLPDGRFQCKGYHFKKNAETDKWEFFCETSQKYKKFFEKLHEVPSMPSDKNYVAAQEAIFRAFQVVCWRGDAILAMPQLLLPNSSKWLFCYSDEMTYVNAQSALLAEVCDVIQPIRTRYLLIDTPILMSGLQIMGKSVELIVIMSPGDTVHYCKTLQASAYFTDEFLRCFWPNARRSCTKQLLCDEIVCQANPKDPLIQMLGVTEKTVTFKDVLMNIIKDEELKLMFTAPNGDAFYATFRAAEGKPMVRNLQKLSATAMASYRAYYDKTKTELLEKADEIYAPLRNHYLQAMKKEQKQDQAAVA